MSILNPAAYTHLHVHSHYSLLQATAPVHALAQRAAAAGMSALALTDTHSLYGAVAFAQACRAAGIQPITGMTIAITPPPDDIPNGRITPGYLVLLATGPTGYQSLCRLSTCLQGFPDRLTRLGRGLLWEDLRSHNHGLICLEAGQTGWMARYLSAGQRQAASRYAGRLGAIFQDRCYVGLDLHEEGDAELARELIHIADRFGMPPVAAQPVYCLEPDELSLLPLLAAIDQNIRIKSIQDASPARYWLNLEEITDRFAAFPEALANVEQIIQQCQPALPDGSTIWPVLDLPKKQTAHKALEIQAKTGLRERKPHSQKPKDELGNRLQKSDYELRLNRELAAIIRHGFSPLFLLVADIVRFAREEDIPVSTRGSVANSLAAYALGITTLDPMPQGLLFERFLNPARANLPDIDLDFCSRRRDKVLEYVRQKYGEERVALVGTMNTLQSKSAVREVAKAYGLTDRQIKRLSALVPRHWHPDPRRRELPEIENVLAELDDEIERLVVQQAYRLVGQPHHLSLHPGGVVITPGPLTDVVPVQWATKGFLTTQFDYRDVELIGLPKIDLLGIRALTVLADTAESIRAHHNPAFHLIDIPLDDSATGDLLTRGETIGVFQCESSGAQRTLRQLRAHTVRDLAVANAFFKPGPATGGMAATFIRRYREEAPVRFLHPALAPILEPTKGVLLFQEQVLRIAVEIAGLSWEQADHLRRGMSKFQAKEMAAMQRAFVFGCQRPSPDGPGFSQEQAESLWEQVIAFAGYGFNQGHATAYAEVSYRSAYLKTHYPAEFLQARLMDRGGFHHPAIYIAEARRLGIAVLPPHVNVSDRKVTLTLPGQEQPTTQLSGLSGPALWLGLDQVRNLRRRSIVGITQNRPFTNLRDLINRVPLQAKEITHLIQCGALDGLGDSRTTLLAEAAEVLRAGSPRQMAFDFATSSTVPPETAAQQLEWEMKILGMPIAVNPLAPSNFPAGAPLRQLGQNPGRRVAVAGFRLPGWTGGKGWFLSDGDGFVIARGGERPSVWEPVVLNGRYRLDDWGGGFFQVEETIS